MSRAELLRQGLRMLRRDWRGGELRLLAAALVIAVGAVTSVGFFVDRVRQGLQRDAAQTMGGDAVVESDRPVDPAWPAEAQRRGLRSARTVAFPSMALGDVPGAAGAPLLVAVKAVSANYPLRGAVRIVDGGAQRDAQGVPASGSAWVEAPVLLSLGEKVGGYLRLGDARLRIAAVIAAEPDRLVQVMGFAPRVLINEQDLPATGLVQPASRVTYRWLIAGDRAAVRALVASLSPRLARGQHLETLDDGRPEMQKTLARADQYLGLVALMTVLVAAVAVGGVARRFCARHLDDCALMRCLGLAQRQILELFAWEFAALGTLASLAGVAAGLGLHLVLLRLFARLLQGDVPLPSAYPALQGLACGLLLLLGFALPPLEQLRRVPPLRVLRRDVGPPGRRVVLAYVAGAAAFAALLLWTAGDARLGAIVGAGFVGCVAAFALAARGLLALLASARRGAVRLAAVGVPWRFALAGVQRRPGASVAQLVALALGLTALLVLAVARTDLVDEWRGQAPPDAPNRFLINIEPDQVEAVRAQLLAAGVAEPRLEPMVRGRLVAIDGRRVGPETYDDERARALVDREFNLSYRADAPAHNKIVQGRWFAPGADELSIEEGIARRLRIRLGQRLRFDVAGEPVEATVTSVRRVNWDSMRVNFFVIMDPSLLRGAPQSFITSFHLAQRLAALPAELVRRFPNLTVIDTDQVLEQVRSLLDRIIAAAQFLFVFALAAGILVLSTALAASHDERVREAALLRALGATRRQLGRAQTAEMVLMGSLAGLLAAAGAAAIAWALARYAFDFDFTPRWWTLVAGVAGGNLAALLGSRARMRRILAAPPMASLRES